MPWDKKNERPDKMPPKKWTAGRNATGEDIALLQRFAEYISNKSSGCLDCTELRFGRRRTYSDIMYLHNVLYVSPTNYIMHFTFVLFSLQYT